MVTPRYSTLHTSKHSQPSSVYLTPGVGGGGGGEEDVEGGGGKGGAGGGGDAQTTNVRPASWHLPPVQPHIWQGLSMLQPSR